MGPVLPLSYVRCVPPIMLALVTHLDPRIARKTCPVKGESGIMRVSLIGIRCTMLCRTIYASIMCVALDLSYSGSHLALTQDHKTQTPLFSLAVRSQKASILLNFLAPHNPTLGVSLPSPQLIIHLPRSLYLLLLPKFQNCQFILG